MSLFTCLYEFHCVQTFETNDHQFSSKSSIGISKEQLSLKSKFRFSSIVRFTDSKFDSAKFDGVKFDGAEFDVMKFASIRFIGVRFVDV